MTWYGYESKVAITKSGALASNVAGQVYAPEDTEFDNPLPVQDLAGVVKGAVSSNGYGAIDEFRVEDRKVVVWYVPGYPPQRIASIDGIVEDNTALRLLAEDARQNAAVSAGAAVAAQAAAEAAAGIEGAGYALLGHTHPSIEITDFQDRVEDIIGQAFTGVGVTFAYNDTTGKVTVTASGGGGTIADAESVQDALAGAFVGIGRVSVAYNDAENTFTWTTTATMNDTDANLRARSTHTGFQAISTITGLQTALDAKDRLRGRQVWIDRATNTWPTSLPALVGPDEFHHWMSIYNPSAPRPPMKIYDAWDAAADSQIYVDLAGGAVAL